MLNARATVRSINEARKECAVPEEEKKEEEGGMQLVGEAKSAMQDLQDLDANPPNNNLTLEERVDMLNVDQRRVYDNISDHLNHHKAHEDGKCQCTLNPLTMFVSGVGETQESLFLIEAIKALTDTLWSSEGLKCITAPTGLLLLMLEA